MHEQQDGLVDHESTSFADRDAASINMMRPGQLQSDFIVYIPSWNRKVTAFVFHLDSFLCITLFTGTGPVSMSLVLWTRQAGQSQPLYTPYSSLAIAVQATTVNRSDGEH